MSTKAYSSYTILDIVDGLQWKGDFSSLENLYKHYNVVGPLPSWAYYNTTDRKSYLYDGEKWCEFSRDGATGATGNGITSETVQYKQSSSNTAPSSNSWLDTFPSSYSTSKPYIWTRIKLVWNDGKITYLDSRLMSQLDVATKFANGANLSLGQWCKNNNVSIVENGMIATGAITANEIDGGAITADKISAGAISADKLQVGVISSAISENNKNCNKNILLSSSFDSLDNWQLSTNENASIEIDSSNTLFGNNSIKIAVKDLTLSKYTSVNQDLTSRLNLDQGTTCTGSIYVFLLNQVDSGIEFRTYFRYKKPDGSIRPVWNNLTNATSKLKLNEWVRLENTFTIPTKSEDEELISITFGFNIVKNGAVYISSPKLELGDKATDWTSSPEDVNLKIASQIQLAKDNIKLEVSERYSTKHEVGDIEGRVTSAESSIQINKNNIALKANKIDLDSYVTFTNLKETDGKTTINGSNITTGTIESCIIKSPNYVSGTSGLKLDLNNGIADITGKITATEGTIGGCQIVDGKLTVGSLSALSANLGEINTGVLQSFNYSDSSIIIRQEPSSLFNQNISEDTYIPEYEEVEIPDVTLNPDKSAYEGLDFAFDSQDQVYWVLGIGTCKSLDIIIPQQYNGYPVVWVYGNFSDTTYNGGLYSIVIPKTVTRIDPGAFYGCTYLESITLPSLFGKKFDYLFKNETTGRYDFPACLMYITFTDEKNLVDDALGKFPGDTLIDVKLNEGLISIGNEAFMDCYPLESINFPKSLLTIGNRAFADCSGLTNIIFSKDSLLQSVGEGAFEGCYNVENIVLPPSLRSIGKLCFYSDEICVSSTLTLLGDNYSLQTIGDDAFLNLDLTDFYLQSLDNWFNIDFGTIASNPINIAHNLSINNILIDSILIPNSITVVKKNSLCNCPLRNLILPESLVSIEDDAFVDNSINNLINLSSLNIELNSSNYSSIGKQITRLLDRSNISELPNNFIIGLDGDYSSVLFYNQHSNANSIINFDSRILEFESSFFIDGGEIYLSDSTRILRGVFRNCSIYYSGIKEAWDALDKNEAVFIDVKIYFKIDATSTIPDSNNGYYSYNLSDGFRLSSDVEHKNLIDSSYFTVSKSGTLKAESGCIGNCILTTDGRFLSKNANFRINEEGDLYAKNVDISGNISALSGSIGNDLIIDDGLKCVSDSALLVNLTKDGLYLNGVKSTLRVGVLDFRADANGSSYLEFSRPFSIRGLQSGESVVSLDFLSNDSANTETLDTLIRIYASKHPTNTSIILLQARSGAKLINTERIDIYYRCCYYTYTSGNPRYIYTSTKSITLYINGGLQESNLYDIEYNEGGSSKNVVFGTDYNKVNREYSTLTHYSFSLLNNTEVLNPIAVTQSKKLNGNIIVKGNLIPKSDKTYSIGNSQYLLKEIRTNTCYTSDGTVESSDKNKKNSILNLRDEYEIIFNQLKPVSFKFNDGTSDRTHTGFIAQDVQAAITNAGLTTKDFAAYCEWKENEEQTTCGLRYEEFIALCVDQIQKLKKRVEELENNSK